MSHALRALVLATGVVVAAVAFVFVGFVALVWGCSGSETRGLCAGQPGLVAVVEWPVFTGAVLAPLAGGIAGFVRRDAYWPAVGVLLAFLLAIIEVALTTGQTMLTG
jgi:hypothetical protein